MKESIVDWFFVMDANGKFTINADREVSTEELDSIRSVIEDYIKNGKMEEMEGKLHGMDFRPPDEFIN